MLSCLLEANADDDILNDPFILTIPPEDILKCFMALGLPFLGMVLLSEISVLAASHRRPLLSSYYILYTVEWTTLLSLFLQLPPPPYHTIKLHGSRFCHAMNLVILPLEIITICRC